MGAIYSVSAVTPAAAAGAPYATIHTGAVRCRILEIGAFVSTAVSSSVSIARASNTPVATTSVLSLAHDAGDAAATINLDTAWSTAPTVGASFMRRIVLPATIGSGIIWPFQVGAGIVLNASSWLVLWNFGAGAGAALTVHLTYEE